MKQTFHVRPAFARSFLALGLACTTLMLSPAAFAAWPDDQPIKMIVPFPPGSSPDILARAISDPLGKALNQVIVIDNKAGAGGNIGTRQATQAKPDGYTLLYTINGPLVTAPKLYSKTLGYDPLTDLAPISLIATSPNLLITSKKLDADTIGKFVDTAKAAPGKYNYGSVGAGSASHLAMEMFNQETGSELAHIPYSGFPDIVNAILAGDIQASFMVPAIAMPHVKADKVNALAITSLKPVDSLPGVPTLADNGYPEFEAISWNAMLAPADTPKEIVDRLHTEVAKIMKDPEIAGQFESVYFTPEGTGPDDLKALITREQETWNPMIDKLGIALD
ncbi:Bug family tripartite tricarboxylate transporter substrate binding protein [Orrella sp. 11846]|uniref:Bug family tripartite tricarboxylate transporter substrate binding protein n=1 Tax=Orrella sp. 11846 TaxID=3409913 RepID=UPI003B5C43C7